MIELDIESPRLKPFAVCIGEVAKGIDPDNPPALGVLCNGSVPYGDATEDSDLDICVCCDAPVSGFVGRRVGRVLVDLHCEDARWLRSVRHPYEPNALFMLAHAEVLWERGNLLSNHVGFATDQFDAPAPALSEWGLFLLKLDCSSRLSRLMNASRDVGNGNTPFLLGGLLEKAVEACLRMNNRWYLDTGHGLRDLREFLPGLAEELSAAGNEHGSVTGCEMLRAFLSKLFDEELPLKSWDGSFIGNGE